MSTALDNVIANPGALVLRDVYPDGIIKNLDCAVHDSSGNQNTCSHRYSTLEKLFHGRRSK